MAKKKKENKPDWVAIKRDYITKNFSYPELAEKYSVPLSTLNKRASKGEWVKAREEYGKIVERKYLNRMSNEQAREYVHVERSLQMILKSIEESLEPVRKEIYKYRVSIDGSPNATVELDQLNTDHVENVLKLIDKAEGLLSRLYGVLPADKRKEYEIAIKQAEAAAAEGNDGGAVQVVISSEGADYGG